jgi:hypothetical protein
MLNNLRVQHAPSRAFHTVASSPVLLQLAEQVCGVIEPPG